MGSRFMLALLVSHLFFPAIAPAEEGEGTMVEEGRSISIEYTLKLDDGSTVDSNVGEQPLVYQQGAQQILPALEKELQGLRVGDTKQVMLTPEKGYGVVDPKLFQEVEANLIPEDARTPGSQLVSQGPGGEQRIVRVHEVKSDKIVIDLNHPLAGKQLNFDVKIMQIE
jgi:FKBP-type peptidyl-prolyl cis-trans isomerase 2